MANKPLPSPEALRQLLRYEPETGKLFWKARGPEWFKCERDRKIWNTRYAGAEAFTTNSDGYRIGAIFGKTHLAHRVAFTLYHGESPKQQIDHINGVRSDNRIKNLRSVSHRENSMNAKVSSRNTSGQVGVHFDKRIGRWTARIHHNKRHVFLGNFDRKEDAVTARKSAEKRFGYHKNHGRSGAWA